MTDETQALEDSLRSDGPKEEREEDCWLCQPGSQKKSRR